MKRLFNQSNIIATVVLLAAVTFTIGTAAISPSRAKPLVRAEVSVPAQRQVIVYGNFDVQLNQGKLEKVVIKADEAVIPKIKTIVTDNALVIYSLDTNPSDVKLYITLEDTENLTTFGKVNVSK